ncbi:retrovirus-related pol polyprotein from transposon TNT 1-94 [Tanacetum coccineum]
MTFECNNLGPSFNCSNFQDSSEDLQLVPSKTDLDNLFGPLYKEYYATSTLEVSDNSAANTLDNEDTYSSSSIIVEEYEAPQIISSSAEPVATEPNTPVSNENVDEFVQEDVAELDGNELIECPVGKNLIAVKWIWKNKIDAENTVIQNKSHLVAKGYGQEEPDGFVDLDFPNHVYCLKKALYGLKQALRAWYDKLSSFLIEHHFTKGIVDPTLFTRRHRDDILLVQIYVDNIIFGSTNQVFLNTFVTLMKDNFEMSIMGEMKFFLELQVHQSPRGIFICQSPYTMDLLKKHEMEKCDTVSTPMATAKLDADL